MQLPISTSRGPDSHKWQNAPSQQNGDPCSQKWSVYQTRSRLGGRPYASTSSTTNESPGCGRPQTIETASSMMRFNSCLDRLGVICCVLRARRRLRSCIHSSCSRDGHLNKRQPPAYTFCASPAGSPRPYRPESPRLCRVAAARRSAACHSAPAYRRAEGDGGPRLMCDNRDGSDCQHLSRWAPVSHCRVCHRGEAQYGSDPPLCLNVASEVVENGLPAAALLLGRVR
jgi:hypothetical protein